MRFACHGPGRWLWRRWHCLGYCKSWRSGSALAALVTNLLDLAIADAKFPILIPIVAITGRVLAISGEKRMPMSTRRMTILITKYNFRPVG